METKPYELQSPEQIAKDYGGNKQKIAEAMQMGILDPTAGTLAGMFIDRMRSAAQAEQAPQQTVAEQVFAPPAPPQPPMGAPAGLGATPEAAQMQAAMPEMGAPEMPMEEMAPPQEMPPQEMPMGMKGGGKVHGRFNASDKGSNYGADISLDDLTSFSLEGSGRRVFDPDIIKAALRRRMGDVKLSAEHTLHGGSDYGIEKPFLGGRLGIHAGASRGFIPDSVRASYNRSFAEGGMIPPYASGGLSDLSVPDGMFDEPDNGSYAGGGLIAFAAGDKVDADEDGDGNPDTYFGYNYKDPSANAAMRDKLFGVPETKYSSEFEADMLKRRSPEALKAGRSKDINMALIEAGIAMANTPGSLLQSATRGIGAALPGFKAAEKERRAEEREIQKGLLDLEQGRNTAAAQKAMQLLDMQRTGIQGREGQIGREFQKESQLAQFAQQTSEGDKDRANAYRIAGMRGSGDGSGSGSGAKPLSEAQTTERLAALRKQVTDAFTIGKQYATKKNFAEAERKFEESGAAQAAYNRLAARAGMPPIGKPGTSKEFNAYVAKSGFPSGRVMGQKVVKNGNILKFDAKGNLVK